MNFSETVKAYSRFKENKTGNAAVTKAELAALRREFKERTSRSPKVKSVKESSQNFRTQRGRQRTPSTKLSEAVKSYREWKLKEHGTSTVTVDEVRSLREGLNRKPAKRVVESRKTSNSNSNSKLSEAVKSYRTWKLKEHGIANVTVNEVRLLKEHLLPKNAGAKSLSNKKLSEAVRSYRTWKLKEHGTAKVSTKEVSLIRESLAKEAKRAKMTEADKCENCNEDEEEEKLQESKTLIMKKLREARRLVFRAKRALREGDMGMAQDATMGAADASMAAGEAVDDMGTADATQGAVPQNIVDAVSAIQASVNDLATQCGLEPPVDLGADAAAGVPAVDGADPNAMAAAPADGTQMMESKKLSDIQKRLKEREEKINSVKAMGASKNALADIGDEIPETMVDKTRRVVKTDSPDTVPSPSMSSLVNGTEKNVTRWPTEKITNIKESYADQYLDRKIQEAKEDNEFKWDKLIKSGILG